MLEIEARQDDALRQLDALERQVERALAESLPLAHKLTVNPGAPSLGLNESHASPGLN